MENNHIDFNYIIEVIELLNKHHIRYTNKFLTEYPKPVNLKKKQINRIIQGTADNFTLDFLFEDYLTKYCNKLAFTQLVIKQEILQLEKYEFTSRVKQPESRLSKLLTYRFEKSEDGKGPVNKCLNDLFGCRVILDFDSLDNAFSILKEKLADFTFIKINKKYNKDYEAIHIYFKGLGNTYFPWELQIWHKDKEKSNKLSHALHKQSYLEWPEIMRR